MKLTKKRKKWIDERDNPPMMRGLPLAYPDIVADKYAAKISSFYAAMGKETEREVSKLFRDSDNKIIATQDASITSQTRILLARLSRKYERIFKRDFTKVVEKMMRGVDTSSKSSVHASLKELSGGLMVKTDFLTGDMKEQFKALSQQNVSLFKTINSEHFAKVESKVMGSITNGEGLKDLVPFFDSFNKSEKNYAKNRALDQTRKAYTTINKSRLEKLGVDEVEWQHSHGSNAPRKLHQKLHGKVFKLNEPPFIGVMYGQDIYGWGGELPNCRCRMTPVIKFEEG